MRAVRNALRYHRNMPLSTFRTGASMRGLDDGSGARDGKPGTLYQFLCASDEGRQKNLNLFKEWVGKDAWKMNRWNARD
jgi:hypothetical protein